MHSHKLVLVMELCNGGSLLNVLEEPRNNTGMHEEDFRVVMSHTSKQRKHAEIMQTCRLFSKYFRQFDLKIMIPGSKCTVTQ